MIKQGACEPLQNSKFQPNTYNDLSTSDCVSVRIKDEDATILRFVLSRDDKIQKISDFFCKVVDGFRVFGFGGKGLNLNNTLQEAGIDGSGFIYAYSDPDPNVELTSKMCILVRCNVANDVYFMMSKTTPMHKMMDAYCQRLGFSSKEEVKLGYLSHGIRHVFQIGERTILGEDTPEVLQLCDGDTIDFYPFCQF